MLTIGQLGAYVGVTTRAVRHYHQRGLLPEPDRDSSGYRRYDAQAVVITRLTPHGLRATFITLALNDGAALRDVQDAARHSDPRTTRLYDRDAGALNRHPVHRLLGLAGG